MNKVSEKCHSSICHIEGGPPLRPTPGRRGGGAVDSEHLLSLLLSAALCSGGHVVYSLVSEAQQSVAHQPLPGPTEVGPVKLRGGRSTVGPPDGMACGEHGDPVVPERSHR